MSTNIFTAESATFSLEAEPSSLPDVIVKMAPSKIFIPLSMLMTASLSHIACTGSICDVFIFDILKPFMDKTCFSSEDKLNNFKFTQAYTNCLTLIEVVSDPIVEQGWCMHHNMISDKEFLDWAQTWYTHDHLLHTHFMLKPFILDVSSLAYEKQFNHCKF